MNKVINGKRYDTDGFLVGKANPGKKVMLADAFYVPERTCRMEQDPDYDFVRCSACGYEEESNILVAVDEGGLVVYDGNYCPNCGAKVVSDDADR